MTDQEIRIAIAEAFGWKQVKEVIRWSKHVIKLPGGKKVAAMVHKEDELPDYPNDLNAMHEAESSISPAQIPQWIKNLADIAIKQACYGPCDHSYWIVMSTARQRAEAFLKTKGLWKKSDLDTVRESIEKEKE